MKNRISTPVVWLLALFALLGAAGCLLMWRLSDETSRAPVDVGAPPRVSPASREARGAELGGPVDAGAAQHARRSVISDEERALARALHAAVEEAARTRSLLATSPPTAAAAPPGVPPAGDEAHGSLDPQYIRDAVRELKPLLAECYERALEEQVGLAGTLMVEFTIEGEPEVGGVVEDTTIAETSTLRHPSLDECVRETMYTLRLPAPEGSGTVHVRYPFRFAPTDDEADAGTDVDGG